MQKPEDHVLVIFGASGDLTRRKLIPALFKLNCQSLLPSNFAVLGVGRSSYTDESFREKIKTDLNSLDNPPDSKELISFLLMFFYISINTEAAGEYHLLRNKLSEIAENKKLPENYIFYLATPPALYEVIPTALASQGLNIAVEGRWRRIIIEKPFGSDLKSARRLNNLLHLHFGEDQVYRIDHYLGKETVQNIMVARFSNGIFEPLWNRNFIHHVEITSAESIGVEERGGYYDSSGTLRDMVQNHLLQLAAVIAMEPPAVNNPTAIRNETLKVFQAMKPFRIKDIERQVIRGQYTASTIRGASYRSYREEAGVHPDSRTETYVALKLFIENWRWGGVPFYIRSGKRLPTRVTEVVIHFKPTPHYLFCFNELEMNHDNQLVIRIQPDEGILLKLGMKVPGAGYRVREVNMDFHYSDLSEMELPEAYERLLLDCMNGDATLYARSDSVEESWKLVDPVLKYWEDHPDNHLHGYPAGTWGPQAADALIEGENVSWRYPCKNLTNDGIYCEL
jgi:glucose-6-phosphate 1-dehydrogenase